jgi:hypothetical protein
MPNTRFTVSQYAPSIVHEFSVDRDEIVMNLGPDTVYLSNERNVTVYSGWPVKPNAWKVWESGQPLFAIADTVHTVDSVIVVNENSGPYFDPLLMANAANTEVGVRDGSGGFPVNTVPWVSLDVSAMQSFRFASSVVDITDVYALTLTWRMDTPLGNGNGPVYAQQFALSGDTASGYLEVPVLGKYVEVEVVHIVGPDNGFSYEYATSSKTVRKTVTGVHGGTITVPAGTLYPNTPATTASMQRCWSWVVTVPAATSYVFNCPTGFNRNALQLTWLNATAVTVNVFIRDREYAANAVYAGIRNVSRGSNATGTEHLEFICGNRPCEMYVLNSDATNSASLVATMTWSDDA